MNLTPIIDMFSGTGEFARARLMLQRGLTAINNERNL